MEHVVVMEQTRSEYMVGRESSYCSPVQTEIGAQTVFDFVVAGIEMNLEEGEAHVDLGAQIRPTKLW